jgi:hypothetical protein
VCSSQYLAIAFNVTGKTAYDLVDDENVRMVFSEELLQATAQSKYVTLR